MKVVVLGGYGAFGALLSELLVRDGHRVWVAGRDPAKARALTDRIGGTPLVVDRDGDLAAVFALAPEVIVDAVGPFQAYGDDRYQLPRRCVAEGVDYLDLCDDAGFAEGIASLDAAARTAGRKVISGASSVPGLSSAVVAELVDGLDHIALIETTILPGNRAPRGRSVIAAIVAQVGRPARVWRGGAWRSLRGWTDRRRHRLGPRDRRSAYFVEVPDIRLFPARFGAASVMFRAGMELGVMNRSLATLARLRQWRNLAVGPRGLAALHWLSGRLLPFGTDTGAMIVRVVGTIDGASVQRQWSLTAQAGDGPYIPGIAVRTLLRRWPQVPPGARACLAAFPLAEAEAAMDDLAIAFARTEAPCPPLFQRALPEDWPALAATVRRLHAVQDLESFSGRARITRGTNPIARAIAALFRFPPAGDDVPVTVTMTRTEAGETWERNFDGRKFRSHLTTARPGHFCERFGPLRFEMALPVKDGALSMPVTRGWFIGIPMPRALLPRSETREFEADGKFNFDVGLGAPFVGLIVRYRGWLAPDYSHSSSV